MYVPTVSIKLEDELLDYLGNIYQKLEAGHYQSFEQFVDWYLFGRTLH